MDDSRKLPIKGAESSGGTSTQKSKDQKEE
jgi:hypothetical protein